MTDNILILEVVGVHGVRGEVTARVYAEALSSLKAYGALSDKSGTRSFVVASARMGAKGPILKLKGVDDRTAAEALRGLSLYVPRAKLPATADDTFYYADLVGLSAVTTDGTRIGRVVAVQNYGAGDLLEIVPMNGGETTLIPFRDAFVPDVDVKGGRVVVALPVMTEAEDEGPGNGRDDEE